jgi:hypothetical protein
MIVYLSLLVAIVGVLMYGLATNAKVVRIGEILFFCGLLAFLLVFHASQPVGILR